MMRPIEIIFSALIFFYFGVRLTTRKPRWLDWLPITAVLFLTLHLAFEGFRWQMIPGYFLAGWTGITAISSLRSGERKQTPGWRQSAGSILGMLLLILMIGLGILLPVPSLPAPTGAMEIGSFTRYLVDNGREESLTKDAEDKRELMVQIWYPAAPEPAARPMPYLDRIDIYGPALARQFNLPSFLFNHINLVHSAAYLDAPPAVTPGRRYPVVIFSHGLTGFRGQNTGMIQELTSHGYVAAAIDHTYGNILSIFPDGRVISYDPCIVDPSCQVTAENGGRRLVQEWTADIQFLLDAMADWSEDPSSPLFGMVDLDHVGVFGHSTGGGTAVEFCAGDSRCQAGLALDGWILPVSENVRQLSQPFMFINTPVWLGDENSARGRALFENNQNDAYLISIAGTEHYDFSDLPMFSPLTPQLGLSGRIDSQVQISILNEYALAFFDQYLKGQETGLLSSKPEYAAVSIQFHAK